MQLLTLLLAACLWAISVQAEEPPSPYLSHLLQRAHDAHLADEREWHLLLHYRADLFGGYTSEQDDPGFFLSPEGKTDPQAELDATLATAVAGKILKREFNASDQGRLIEESVQQFTREYARA